MIDRPALDRCLAVRHASDARIELSAEPVGAKSALALLAVLAVLTGLCSLVAAKRSSGLLIAFAASAAVSVWAIRRYRTLPSPVVVFARDAGKVTIRLPREDIDLGPEEVGFEVHLVRVSRVPEYLVLRIHGPIGRRTFVDVPSPTKDAAELLRVTSDLRDFAFGQGGPATRALRPIVMPQPVSGRMVGIALAVAAGVTGLVFLLMKVLYGWP